MRELALSVGAYNGGISEDVYIKHAQFQNAEKFTPSALETKNVCVHM